MEMADTKEVKDRQEGEKKKGWLDVKLDKQVTLQVAKKLHFT